VPGSRWDERRVRLSGILAAIAAIGYRAYPYDAAKSEQLARHERRSALWRVFVAGFGMMQVMMYAVPVYLAGDGEMTPAVEQLMRWASLALTAPVVFYSAAPFFPQRLARSPAAPSGNGCAGGAGHRRRFCGQCLGRR
jgi:Cu2+-exporting ATPase